MAAYVWRKSDGRSGYQINNNRNGTVGSNVQSDALEACGLLDIMGRGDYGDGVHDQKYCGACGTCDSGGYIFR